MTERHEYLVTVASQIRELHQRYAKLTRTFHQTPESYRERMSVAEQIQVLLETVTPEEQNLYEIW